MNHALQTLSEAWTKRKGPAVLATVNPEGQPNIIYVGEIDFQRDRGFIIADNYFHKTRRNIEADSPGAVLFITEDRQAYQAKGRLAYFTEGPVFDDMQDRHDPKHPGVAATLLQVDELYSGAEKLL